MRENVLHGQGSFFSPADHESEDLSPEGVLVGLGVLDGLVLDEVEDEEERHEARRDHHPAPVPDLAHPEPDHLGGKDTFHNVEDFFNTHGPF